MREDTGHWYMWLAWSIIGAIAGWLAGVVAGINYEDYLRVVYYVAYDRIVNFGYLGGAVGLVIGICSHFAYRFYRVKKKAEATAAARDLQRLD